MAVGGGVLGGDAVGGGVLGGDVVGVGVLGGDGVGGGDVVGEGGSHGASDIVDDSKSNIALWPELFEQVTVGLSSSGCTNRYSTLDTIPYALH
jgi:hypothetical protein